MQKSKLVEILEGLNPKERKSLQLFIQSSIKKPSSNKVKLLQYLIEQLNMGNKENLEKEIIRKKIFPKTSVSQQEWRYMSNELVTVAKEYLRQFSSEEKSSIANQYFLTEYFMTKGMSKNFQYDVKQLEHSLSEPKERDSNHHLFEYWTTKLHIGSEKDSRKLTDKLDLLNQQLDMFYLENKLMILTEIANRNRVVQRDDSLFTLESFYKDLIKDHYPESIGIKINHHLYKLIKEPSPKEYLKVKELLFQEEYGFSTSYEKNICLYLMNQCMNFINQGNSDFAKEFMDLTKHMIKHEILIDTGEIPASRFKNIVAASLRINDLSWAEDFVKSYHKFIKKSLRRSAHQLSQAEIAFYKGEFEIAHRKLRGFDVKDMYFRIAHDRLLLKIFFEKKDRDAVEVLAKSFLRYINRETKLSKEKKEAIRIFIKQIRGIAKNLGRNDQKISKIRLFLESNLNVLDRDWFLSKLNG